MRSTRTLTRRTLVALASAARVCAQAEDKVASLGETAARVGLPYGSDSDSQINHEPPMYAQLMRRHIKLFAPVVQWRRTQPRQGDRDPHWEDPNIRFAWQNGMRLMGGHLIWHESGPDWLRSTGSRNAMERAIVRHVMALGRIYSGKVFSWNVVNEAIEPRHGRADGMRRTLFLDMFVEAFFEFGFHAAREAEPSAVLAYSDCALEMASPHQEHRRRALIRLLDRLLARQVAVGAVGLQSHLRLNGDSFGDARYQRFLKEISDRGLRVVITELDVLDDGRGRTIAARDADIAYLYARFLSAALDEKAVVALVTWGLSDRYSWLSPAESPKMNPPSGPRTRPLPFDTTFHSKPAYDAIMAALRAAPMRADAKSVASPE